ncbi:Arabinanase/levansucrase/invertase, partial [Fistulina hepatica ATCC 64428]
YVRDPSIIWNADSQSYFLFSTGNNVSIFKSASLEGPWELQGSVLPSCSVIQLDGRCTIWAPDVHYVNEQYVLYYAVSTLGSQDSAIGVATSDTMEAGTWTDHGEVLSSTSGDTYNAIDPNLVQDDDGDLSLLFGSYWGGIFEARTVSRIFSRPDSLLDALFLQTLPGTHIAGGNGSAEEGGYIYKKNSTYWLFFSQGTTGTFNASSLPSDPYKVRSAQSNNTYGPFYGQLGNNVATENGPGTIILASHDNVYAPGGQSVYSDPNTQRDVIVYHYNLYSNVSGDAVLGVDFLDFSAAWPTVTN